MATEKEPLITKEMEDELSSMGSGLTPEEEKETAEKAESEKKGE